MGGGRTGQIIDFVNFDVERKRHVVADDFEIGIIHQVKDVIFAACIEIIHTDDFMPFGKKPFTYV